MATALPPSSVAALRDALKDTLERRGVLDALRARVRGELFHVIEAAGDAAQAPPAPLSSANLLLNELILEYLDYNGYANAASVLSAEASQPRPRLDRRLLAREVRMTDVDTSADATPLLYHVLASLQSAAGPPPLPTPQPVSYGSLDARGQVRRDMSQAMASLDLSLSSGDEDASGVIPAAFDAMRPARGF